MNRFALAFLMDAILCEKKGTKAVSSLQQLVQWRHKSMYTVNLAPRDAQLKAAQHHYDTLYSNDGDTKIQLCCSLHLGCT